MFFNVVVHRLGQRHVLQNAPGVTSLSTFTVQLGYLGDVRQCKELLNDILRNICGESGWSLLCLNQFRTLTLKAMGTNNDLVHAMLFAFPTALHCCIVDSNVGSSNVQDLLLFSRVA